MATSGSLWGGILAAVIGIFFSIILFVAAGIPAEKILIGFETTNVSENGTIYDIAAPWNTGYDDVTYWMTILYLAIISPALLGITIMFLSAIKTQEYDVFEDEENSYGGQAIPQYVTPEEIAFRRQM